MMCRGVGLIFFILFFSGCAYMEGPRWALLGDTSEQAFFIDRQNVQRLPNGNYLYPVKICIYQEERPHEQDESHDTNKVLLVEMNCREKQWTETSRNVIDQDNKVLFRYTSPLPTSQPIEPGTIHFAAYKYLCSGSDVIAQHNH